MQYDIVKESQYYSWNERILWALNNARQMEYERKKKSNYVFSINFFLENKKAIISDRYLLISFNGFIIVLLRNIYK